MADKKSSKKLQFIMFGLCSLVAVAACMVVLVVTTRSVENSNTVIVEHDTVSKTQLSDDAAVLTDYIAKLTGLTAENKFIKADVYTDVSVDDSAFKVYDMQGSEADNSLLIYAKNKIMGAIDGYYAEDITGVFGTVYEAMPVVNLPQNLLETVRYSVGEADENGNPVYNTDTGELIDADYYFVNFTLNYENIMADQAAAALFSLDEKQSVADKLKSDISTVCAVENATAELTGLNINAKINRLNDKIEYINFEKVYAVSADAEFVNEFAVFGSKHVEIEYKVNNRFEYSYAGISFLEKSVTVEPGKEVVLSVNAVIEDDSEYTVTFSSSDTAVATVDEMGYVNGITASCNPVTVTVTLEYLGETFTDECTVIVNDNENPNG